MSVWLAKEVIEGTLTVTGYDKEFIVITKLMNCHIRISGHDLLFGRKLGAFLELEITNSSRQGQVSVHTAEIDKATCGTDTSLLA